MKDKVSLLKKNRFYSLRRYISNEKCERVSCLSSVFFFGTTNFISDYDLKQINHKLQQYVYFTAGRCEEYIVQFR